MTVGGYIARRRGRTHLLGGFAALIALLLASSFIASTAAARWPQEDPFVVENGAGRGGTTPSGVVGRILRGHR